MKVRLRHCGGYVTCWGTSSAQSAAWQRVTSPALPWDWTDNREWNVRPSSREAQEFYVQVWICYLSCSCTWTKLPPCRSPGSVAWSLPQRLPVWGSAPDVVGLSPAPTHKFISFLLLDILIFSLALVVGQCHDADVHFSLRMNPNIDPETHLHPVITSQFQIFPFNCDENIW